MTFLVPAALALAAVAAGILVVMHLIARHRPPREPLPTARFVPRSAARITARAIRLTDPWLLALRLLVIAAAALAIAGPISFPARQPLVRVIMIDRSRAVADVDEVRDSVRTLTRAGDVLVAFDSAAQRIALLEADSIPVAGVSRVEARGSLSAALVAGLRAVGALRDRADSVELVLVSALVREQVDAATADVRALHAGRIRVVRVAAAARGSLPRSLQVRDGGDDPLAATLALFVPVAAGDDGVDGPERHDLRLVRSAIEPADSAWLSVDERRVLVHWPADPSVLARRARPDTAGALVAGSTVVLATFERAAVPHAGGAAMARWGDGAPAASERRPNSGGGCLREVAVAVPATGDVVLRPAFGAFVAAMLAPCGGPGALEPVTDSLADLLRGSGPLVAPAALGGSRRDGRSPWTPWLLALAIAGLLLEWPLRRRGA